MINLVLQVAATVMLVGGKVFCPCIAEINLFLKFSAKFMKLMTLIEDGTPCPQ